MQTHDAKSDIARYKQDIIITTRLRGHTLILHSTWGLFSPKEIDEGSALLIEHFDVEDGQKTLEIGCGYGPIGIAIARQTPAGEVHMVDKDFVAVAYAEKNGAGNGVSNCRVYLSNAFSAVPADLRFDNIVSNLPAKVGKEMLAIILDGAYHALVPGGRICVVTISGLRKWIKRNFLDVFGNYTKVKQGKTYTVAQAVKPRTS